MGNRLYRGVLLMGLLCGLCGCVTQKLWEKTPFDGFNEPAHPANLQVWNCESDWLVQYDEVNENSDRVRRRAYYLIANARRVRERKAPRFVTRAVPIATEARVMISDDAAGFTLYDGDKVIGRYELPVYPAPSGHVKQILLTPFAVVADTAIVAGTGALFLGCLWLQSGAPLPD